MVLRVMVLGGIHCMPHHCGMMCVYLCVYMCLHGGNTIHAMHLQCVNDWELELHNHTYVNQLKWMPSLSPQPVFGNS